MGININGASELAADMRNVSVRKLTQTVVRKTAKDIQGTAKRMAPVDTGNLKNSITTSDLRSLGSDTLAAEIGPTASYGIYQELGTSKMAPQPFLGPAADIHEPAFMQAMEQVAERGLNG